MKLRTSRVTKKLTAEEKYFKNIEMDATLATEPKEYLSYRMKSLCQNQFCINSSIFM